MMAAGPPTHLLSAQEAARLANARAARWGSSRSGRGRDASLELQPGGHGAPASRRLPPAGEDGRDSPHPCAIPRSARAAERAVRTAVTGILLISLGAALQRRP